MRADFRILLFCFYISAGPHIAETGGQILRDTSSVSLIKVCANNLYNFNFSDAEEIIDIVTRGYPDHPAGYLLNSLLEYWKSYPLLPGNASQNRFVSNLKKCIELCENTESAGNKEEFLLINLCARGMLLLFYSDNGMSGEVLKLAAGTYPHLMDAFEVTSEYGDFNLFTGLYNYYREAYPEVYPVYKAIIFLFPRGDREKGLEQINLACQNSIFLRAEAYSFLSWIMANFENDYVKATETSQILYELYPVNPQYKIAYIKNLLLIKMYDEAERVMKEPGDGQGSRFYHAQLHILEGVLQEKKYHNTKSAIQFYEKGLKEIAQFQNYANEYSSFAYFGLSRISDSKNENARKEYRKKAMELATFKNVNFD